jgi:hypothetical protein
MPRENPMESASGRIEAIAAARSRRAEIYLRPPAIAMANGIAGWLIIVGIDLSWADRLKRYFPRPFLDLNPPRQVVAKLGLLKSKK